VLSNLAAKILSVYKNKSSHPETSEVAAHEQPPSTTNEQHFAADA
jgi:hypothetical protein